NLVLDAKRISNRLNDKLVLGDSLINDIEFVNEQLKTLRNVHDKFDVLNELSRNKSNQNLAIQKKYPHIQEIQHENRELRACLQDYQRTMEHVMTKYREHTQQKITNSKFTFSTSTLPDDYSKYEQIDEMLNLMRRAAEIGESKELADIVLINKLATENQGLRELLKISKEFGSQSREPKEEEKLEEKSQKEVANSTTQ
ncbi:FGFR1 oncogene partner 2 like, partial [Pseudolycoriella hygida]